VTESSLPPRLATGSYWPGWEDTACSNGSGWRGPGPTALRWHDTCAPRMSRSWRSTAPIAMPAAPRASPTRWTPTPPRVPHYPRQLQSGEEPRRQGRGDPSAAGRPQRRGQGPRPGHQPAQGAAGHRPGRAARATTPPEHAHADRNLRAAAPRHRARRTGAGHQGRVAPPPAAPAPHRRDHQSRRRAQGPRHRRRATPARPASAPRSPANCSPPPETTPTGCGPRPRSRTYAATPRSRLAAGGPIVTASTAPPTTLSTPSSWAACATTPEPVDTPTGGPSRD